jgi:hypothetical protein
MTFNVSWADNREYNGPGMRQIFVASINFVHEFAKSVGGIDVIANRNNPKCAGITEWAEKKYGISVVDRYTTRIEPHSWLGPHPMEKLGRTGFNDRIYIPHDTCDPPWGNRRQDPTKDELRVFMDPVFVGPRSPADRKFFHSEAIKIGLRKKIGPRHRAYEQCQTPELRRWQEDMETSRLMSADQGAGSATEWAAGRGWEKVQIWSTEHMDVSSFDITMPGCEGKPDTYEKLLFVLKFSGRI